MELEKVALVLKAAKYIGAESAQHNVLLAGRSREEFYKGSIAAYKKDFEANGETDDGTLHFLRLEESGVTWSCLTLPNASDATELAVFILQNAAELARMAQMLQFSNIALLEKLAPGDTKAQYDLYQSALSEAGVQLAKAEALDDARPSCPFESKN